MSGTGWGANLGTGRGYSRTEYPFRELVRGLARKAPESWCSYWSRVVAVIVVGGKWADDRDGAASRVDVG